MYSLELTKLQQVRHSKQKKICQKIRLGKRTKIIRRRIIIRSDHTLSMRKNSPGSYISVTKPQGL